MTTNSLAVVTGGSSGIGFALAKQFAKHGFDLILAAEDEGLRTCAEQVAALGVRCEAVRTDLSEPSGVEHLVQYIREQNRKVDALAINAGVGVGGVFATGTSLEEELTMIRLNVLSSVHLTKRIVPDMVAAGRGRILFTASVASIMPAPYEAVYGATKAFILSFSSSLHHELQGTGVTVTAVLPGPTETNFFHRAHMDDTKVGSQKKDDPAEVARQAFDALMAGKEREVTGSLRTKLMGTAARFIPEKAKAKFHAEMSRPGSARR